MHVCVFNMELSKTDQLISDGLSKLGYTTIRLNQRKVVEAYMKKKDVFFCSPTGSGKSLCFEIAPFVFDGKQYRSNVTIVVSPLSSLMKTQSISLNKKEIKAVYLRDTYDTHKQQTLEEEISSLTLDDIKEGNVDIVLASPESLLGNQRKLILNLAKDGKIITIFVDEAHCVVK